MTIVCVCVCVFTDAVVGRRSSRSGVATADRALPQLRVLDGGQQPPVGHPSHQRHGRHRVVPVQRPTPASEAPSARLRLPPRGTWHTRGAGRRRRHRSAGGAAATGLQGTAASHGRRRQRATSPQERVSASTVEGQV